MECTGSGKAKWTILLILSLFGEAAHACGTRLDADVLILGAGISGVAAAKTLFEAGVRDILVLEARDEIGGRMRNAEFAGITVELGANWIHGVRRNYEGNSNGPSQGNWSHASSDINPIWTLKEKCGLEGVFTNLTFVPGPLVVYNMSGDDITKNKILRYSDMIDAVAKIDNISKIRENEGQPDESVQSALLSAGWNPTTSADKLLEWVTYNLGDANTPDRMSLFKSTKEDYTFTEFGEYNFYVTDKRGYAHLVRCMGDEFDLTKRLRLNTTIRSVDYSNGDCVCATSESGKQFCGKKAIVTFSVGVLQENYVTFTPDLPKSKRDPINLIANGLFLRIFLEFNETFWDIDPDVVFICRTTPDVGDYAVFQPVGQYYPSKPNVLLAVLVSKKAMKVASQDIETTKEQILSALRTIYPNFRAKILNTMVPDWGSNPLYKGSFSSYLVDFTNEMIDTIAAPIDNLYISGEALSKKYSAYVHGGYFSGINTANMVLRELQRSSGSRVISSCILIVVTMTVVYVF